MEKPAIVHMDLDTFFVSVERLLDSSLNNIPVIVGGSSNRGVVSACSYEARKFGVQSGMPIYRAKQLCPEAKIVNSGFSQYGEYSKKVTQIIEESVPLFEKSSIDEFYIDFTGMDKYFGAFKYACNLRQRIIKETGLPISFGMSVNKTVSKIATGEAKPNNQMLIKSGEEKGFLAPLNIAKIPMLGKKTQSVLYQLGYNTISDIQNVPVSTFEKQFGKNGKILWLKANGIDNGKIKPFRERKSISSERTFEQNTQDVAYMRSVINAMVESLSIQLRKLSKYSACVGIKIRYSDFKTVNTQRHIKQSCFDADFSKTALILFNEIYNTSLSVRLIGVKLSEFCDSGLQLNLFENNESQLKLYNVLDEIRAKHGKKSIRSAINTGTKYIGRSNPFKGGE